MAMMMKKRYEKPTMRVVELQQHTMLLAGSAVEATRNDYGDANLDVVDDPMNLVDGNWMWN